MTKFVHFSSRPQPPEVPHAAVNFMAGGTGPIGIYAYPTDARSMTFAADRAYAFLLEPTVRVQETGARDYGQRDLERDLERLAELVDIARPLRLFDKFRGEIVGHTGYPPFAKLWYVLSRIPSPMDVEEGTLPNATGASFANPVKGRDLLLELGYPIVFDRLGILYKSEPEQAVFLYDGAFVATPIDPRTYNKRKAMTFSGNPVDDFEEMAAKYSAAKQRDIAAIKEALVSSKAIHAQTFGKSPMPRMALVTGEITDRDVGDLRVTFFAEDGPMGHATRKTEDDIAEEIREMMAPPYTPMTEADVIAWTTAWPYEIGSRKVACVQAINSLSWYASQAGRRDLFEKAEAAANLEVRGENGRSVEAWDRALTILHDAIRELPTRNPKRALVRNPAWVSAALADHYAVLDDKVPARWMPQLAGVTNDRKKLLADLVEYGCGAYGCVIATNDPHTVLKVTTDDTEAEFAAEIAPTLVAPICVNYELVVRLSSKYKGRPIHLLWREAAEKVGEIKDEAPEVYHLVKLQHRAGQMVYDAIMKGHAPGEIRRLLANWVQRVDMMGGASALRGISQGLLKVWEEQHIFFGDLHDGNLGLVKRDDGDAWVITDPGHVAVIEDPDLWG